MDFTHFEKLYHALPHVVRDRHPDGSLVVMQACAKIPCIGGPDAQTIRNAAMNVLKKMKRPVTPESLALFGVKDGPITDTHLRSAVWDSQSGSLVWAPTNTIAMAWLHQGREVALLREGYDPQPEMHKVIGSPLQSEFTYTWERCSWPEKQFISSCSIIMPTGWPTALTISPCADLATFQWMDQGESGLEFIAISDQGDHQVLQTGLPILENVTDLCFRSSGNGFPIGSNLMAPPVFSPDGRYIVFAWQDGWKWWAEASRTQGAGNASDFLRKTGTCQIGFVEVIDWEQRHVRELAISTTLPHSWSPSDFDDKTTISLLSALPTFIDSEHFTLLLPTKEVKTYSIHEEGPTTRLVTKTSQDTVLREQARIKERSDP